ncbi:hypothetical protein [Geomonas subterranea]|uniref:Uncharacterized protein n=1 Tax=Geomonas subterranea TaxID=2847989 RepID=A0ABX8LKP5_9BACT|nr:MULTISPECIES: hypothetical protein [Geomonas]QXE91946.1 hypothetical protein KP001_05290 [Geomonas subterranea]QXM09961.1 hypothetical protein KP002_02205 [Geomonas subterranea]
MQRVRYEHVHQIRFTAVGAETIGDLIRTFEESLQLLKHWDEKGIQLDPHGVGSNYAIFYTYDEAVAREEGFERIRTESGNPLPRR